MMIVFHLGIQHTSFERAIENKQNYVADRTAHIVPVSVVGVAEFYPLQSECARIFRETMSLPGGTIPVRGLSMLRQGKSACATPERRIEHQKMTWREQTKAM